MGDESGGPVAQLLAIPAGHDGGSDDEGDPLMLLKGDIRSARGKALLLETMASGWYEGRSRAPQGDWMASRLGPHPRATMPEIARNSFSRTLAACGCTRALFDDSDGNSKREARRQWHHGTVLPLARMLETELTEKLETPIRLRFDLYTIDLAGRAQAFQKWVTGGVPVNEALATSGLLADA